MEFLSFIDSLANEFSQMNLAWVKKYFKVELTDELVLSDPRKNIIDKGGYIFFAKTGDTIAGTFALLKVNDQEFELSKMAVKEEFIGRNVGNAMLTFCLQKAKALVYKNWCCTQIQNSAPQFTCIRSMVLYRCRSLIRPTKDQT